MLAGNLPHPTLPVGGVRFQISKKAIIIFGYVGRGFVPVL